MPITVRNLDAPGQAVILAPATSATPADTPAASGCCGGAAPAGADACCALDAEVKATGGSGCGCSTAAPAPAKSGCC
jgi:hypothetical protein